MSPKPARALLISAALASVLAAGLGLLSGFVSNADSTTYRWSRGAPLGSSSNVQTLDSSASEATLLLSARVPDRVDLHWTCTIGQEQAESAAVSRTVLATFKGSENSGLYLETVANRFQFSVRGKLLASVQMAGSANERACEYSIVIKKDGTWVLRRGTTVLANGITELPYVTGVSTDLKPSEIGPGESVVLDMTSVPHGPSTSGARTSLRLIASGLGIGSVLLLLATTHSTHFGRRPVRDGLKWKLPLRRWTAWLDHAVVIGVLLAWWLVGPVLFDDGWVMASIENYSSDLVVSNYYDSLNAALPLGYVHEVTIAAFGMVSRALLWLRVPALIAGLAAWALVRSVVDHGARTLRSTAGFGPHITAASIFLLSWISWNNTLRPEPMTALLAVMALWVSVRFANDQDPRLLIVGSIAVGLGLSMGTSGVVCLAPSIVVLPVLLVWLKEDRARRLLSLGAAIFIGITVLILAVLLVGDTDFWSASRQTFRSEAVHSLGLFDEHSRYQLLFSEATSSAVRRLSVFLPFVVLITFIFRRDRRDTPANIPVLGLLAALLLLALTPSKWIWHFGSLAAIAAAACGTEVHRWTTRAVQARNSSARPLFVLGSTVFGAAVAWQSGFGGWNDIALLRLNQDRGMQMASAILFDPLVMLAVVLAVSVVLRLRATGDGRALKLTDALGRVGAWIVPVTALVAVGTAVNAFALDGFGLSPGWSRGRQNIAELTAPTCGLADEILVPSIERTLPLANREGFDKSVDPANVSYASALTFEPDGVYFRSEAFYLDVDAPVWGSRINGDDDTGWFASPWYSVKELRSHERADLFVSTAGRPSSASNRLFLQVARETTSGVKYLPFVLLDSSQDSPYWQSVNIGPFVADEFTSAIRLIGIDGSQDVGGWLAFSSPYQSKVDRPLLDVIEERGGTVLVAPQIRTYFPCLRQPKIRNGSADLPSVIISVMGWPYLLPGSPHRLLSDVADLRPVSSRWAPTGEHLPFEVILVDGPKKGPTSSIRVTPGSS